MRVAKNASLVVVIGLLGFCSCLGYLAHVDTVKTSKSGTPHRKSGAPKGNTFAFEENESSTVKTTPKPPKMVDFCTWKHTQEVNAQRKIQERSNWFEAEIPHERGFFRSTGLESFVTGFLFSPYYACPFTLEKSTSVKDHFDGGKWLCGLKELADSNTNATCRGYSFGSNYDLTFERQMDEISSTSKCELHIYDPTMSAEQFGHSHTKLAKFISDLPKNYVLHEIGMCAPGKDSLEMDGRTFDAISLLEALKLNGHEETGIDVLKFDVEGFEYDILETTEWDKAKIGIILFEVHANIIQRTFGVQYTLLKFHWHIQRMEKAGYRLYSMEPVCGGCTGQFEVAMVHKDWHPVLKFERYYCGELCTLDDDCN